MERGTRFELAHPRVEASVHSLYYVTPAKVEVPKHCIKKVYFVKKNLTVSIFLYNEAHQMKICQYSSAGQSTRFISSRSVVRVHLLAPDLSRSGAVVARKAHNLEVVCSIHTSATILILNKKSQLYDWDFFFFVVEISYFSFKCLIYH